MTPTPVLLIASALASTDILGSEFRGMPLLSSYSSGIQTGVRVPQGVREDIWGDAQNLKNKLYIIFRDKHSN
jgi:hypothetical protein